MDGNPHNQKEHESMTRDQLILSILGELKTDVKDLRSEFKRDMKELFEKQAKQGDEITHLKWKSGIISAVAGFLSGLSGKMFE